MNRFAATAVATVTAGLLCVGLVACVDPEEACAAPGPSAPRPAAPAYRAPSAPRPAPAAPRVGSAPKAPQSRPTVYRTETRNGHPVVVPVIVGDDDYFESDCDD